MNRWKFWINAQKGEMPCLTRETNAETRERSINMCWVEWRGQRQADEIPKRTVQLSRIGGQNKDETSGDGMTRTTEEIKTTTLERMKVLNKKRKPQKRSSS